MADDQTPNADDSALFKGDFQEVPLDEPADEAVKKAEKKGKQPASMDILEGLVQQARMEELLPEDQGGEANQPGDSASVSKSSRPLGANAGPDIGEPEDADETPDGSGSGSSDDGDDAEDAEGKPSKAKSAPESVTMDAQDVKPGYPDDAHLEMAPQVSLEPVRVLEAALFLANKPMGHKQLQDLLAVPRERLDYLLADLARLVPKESSYELAVNEHGAALQLKPHYLHRVAKLSKEVELSKKSMRILALVAKKKELLQSDLKHFFKGEIYAYVTELKMAGYLESKKAGNTRRLKPTTKFFESFQVKE